MTAHTPGPWVINAHAIESDGPEAALIAHVYGPDENGPEEHEHNRRLIAAAPDLLAAIERIRERLEPNTHLGYASELLEIAEAAIAKAEGK